MLAANCHAGNYAGRWVVVVDEDIETLRAAFLGTLDLDGEHAR